MSRPPPPTRGPSLWRIARQDKTARAHPRSLARACGYLPKTFFKMSVVRAAGLLRMSFSSWATM